MPPLPKRRLSPGRRDRRRAHHALTPPHLVECPQCHKMRRPHHVCPHCGYYKGREVIEVEEG
ncbi:MAG TPA: 50S ribosomal protein L32 [Caldilineae bacterium]|nr:50S ribosomal protein L32 [Caldilineae bacterium]